jgi:hypothetical protein
MAQIKLSEPVSCLLISAIYHRSDGRGDGLRLGAARARAREGVSRPSAVSRRSLSFLELRWSISDEICSLQDHSVEGNSIMLTLIGGERQQSPTTVRRLDRCLATVREASGEASAPRACAEASLNSLLASRPTNCSEWRRKTQIWWLPRVRWVLDMRPKIRTTGGAIYRGF